MFDKKILKTIEKWKQRNHRKPLVLRGARQVGKTTLVQQFALGFEQYIYLNLELPGFAGAGIPAMAAETT